MSTPLPLIDAALRGMVLALLLLMAARLLRERPKLPAGQAGVLLSLGLAVQVFSSTPAFESTVSCAMQSPLVGVSVANALAFYFFVKALFHDDFRWRPWHAAAWLLAFAVGLLNCGVRVDTGSGLYTLLRVLLRVVPLAGAVLAIHAAVVHWRDDLVEARRRLRVFVVVTGVLYTLAQLAARLGSPQGRFSSHIALLDVGGLLLIAGGIAWQLLRLAQSELFPDTPTAAAPAALQTDPLTAAADAPSAPPLPPAAPDPAEDRLAAALQQLMQHDRAYRDEDLTVAALAARLAVPEYRLRRLINQRLGHRNFNAFVNGYRLAEARTALADPARRELPVLSIALEAGFGSIGPFNRAFKAETGLTPTEYRKNKLADS